MSVRIITGDALTELAKLPAESVHCCVTSPPYYGLRSYLPDGHEDKHREMGAEATPDEYVAAMVGVFREVKRVLRSDATCWIVIGDSYAGSWGAQSRGNFPSTKSTLTTNGGRVPKVGDKYSALSATQIAAHPRGTQTGTIRQHGLKPKDLIGIPWALAFALRADGWWLRQDIIWSKKNCMPESVTDRCTKSHEYIFLLAKGQWSRRSVELSDLSGERSHLVRRLGVPTADSWAAHIGVDLATAILDCPEVKQQLGSILLEPQIGQQGESAASSASVESLPPIKRVAGYASRLLDGDASAKEFLCEIHRIGFVLGKRGHFLIRGSDTEIALPPSVNRYGETSVAVHDAGKIGEFDFVHGRIIAHAPTTCSYYFDAAAIAEPALQPYGIEQKTGQGKKDALRATGTNNNNGTSTSILGSNQGSQFRNKRSVWTIATAPLSSEWGETVRQVRVEADALADGKKRKASSDCPVHAGQPGFGCTCEFYVETVEKTSHFAAFPPALVEPCIMAGTSARGVCPSCGAPWVRVVKTLDWLPSCCCPAAEPVPATVLDCFLGAGTTALVADRLGRSAIGIELSPTYVSMARRRIEADAGMFSTVEAAE